MKDLALHILDIAQNSIVAGAKIIELEIEENLTDESIWITLKDDGKGMAPELLENVLDPYVTTRTTRKVGLGLPLFKSTAEQTGGALHIKSKPGIGTEVQAKLSMNHIDLPPWGDITGVIVLLATTNAEIDFNYIHCSKFGKYVFDTRQVKSELEGVSLNEPEIRQFLRLMIQENLDEIDAFNTEPKIACTGGRQN